MYKQYRFDAFLSYKSEDYEWVAKLQEALEQRGARVWIDRDAIGPAKRSIQALEEGIENSRALIRVVTPQSVEESEWVADEYNMAKRLANSGRLRLIPLILRETELGGFLANHQAIDFRDPTKFEQNVDKLVWPGITGKEVLFSPFPYCVGETQGEQRRIWHRLIDAGREIGLTFLLQDRVYRVVNGEYSLQRDGTRTVVVANIFDKTDHFLVSTTKPYHTTYSEFIRDLRSRTKGADDEVLFLMYQKSTAWKSPEASMLSTCVVERFRHYFTLHSDITEDRDFSEKFAKIWRYRIQPELLQSEPWRTANTHTT